MQLRPENSPPRLFLGFRYGKCIKQPIGINSLATFPRRIAEFLGLENAKMYTSHAFRRSAATWVADSGVDLINLKRFGGWKSDSVAQNYIAESITVKTDLAEALQGVPERQQVRVDVGSKVASSVQLNISNCQDCVFNIKTCKE